MKGKVTTATQQVALSTIGASDEVGSRSKFSAESAELNWQPYLFSVHFRFYSLQKTDKKPSKLFMKLNSLDRSHKPHSSSMDAARPTAANKCSVQEGVRMMVTPSMFMSSGPAQERAILNPPANVQRAVIVTQENFETSKTFTVTTATASEPQLDPSKCEVSTELAKIEAGKSAKNNGNLNGMYKIGCWWILNASSIVSSQWVEQRAISPTNKPLGRQKRIVEPSITPATTPISYTSPTPMDDAKASSARSVPAIRSFPRLNEYGSPESPLSKMNVLLNPLPPSSQDKVDSLMSSHRWATLIVYPSRHESYYTSNYSQCFPTGIPDAREIIAHRPAWQRRNELIGGEGAWSTIRPRYQLHETGQLWQIWGSIGASSNILKIHLTSLTIVTFYSQSTGNDVSLNSRANSPRRLTKQTALESPTAETKAGALHSPRTHAHSERAAGSSGYNVRKDETSAQQRQRLRKIGPFAVDSQSIPDSRSKYAGSWPPPAYESDGDGRLAPNAPNTIPKQGPNKEEKICHRCSECGSVLESYNDEEIGIMIIILNTLIHREPSLAASFLPEILVTVAK